MDLPLDEAFLGIDMLSALGPDEPEARAAGQRSREILERLGATPLVAILDDISAARASSERPARGKRGAGTESVAEADTVAAG
jgi:hypothetical protein